MNFFEGALGKFPDLSGKRSVGRRESVKRQASFNVAKLRR